jgi:hypothetical protein
MNSMPDLCNKLSLSAIAFVTTFLLSSSSNALNIGPNFGVDAVMSKVKFKKDYGENIYPKKFAPGINFFAGCMFHKNFGVELGYEVEKKMRREATVNYPAYVAGVYVAAGGGVTSGTYDATIKQRHPYLGLIVKTTIFNEHNLVGLMLGMARSHIVTKNITVKDNLGPLNTAITTRNFTKTKAITIARLMVEHKVHQTVGFKNISCLEKYF